MIRERVLLTWIEAGIRDFYLSFELQATWTRHSNFFCHQGLEKICKAYYIAKCASSWQGLPEQLALKKVDRIARLLDHDLVSFVKCMQARRVLPGYPTCRSYSESNLLQGLQAAYIEARYPVPHPYHLKRDTQNNERFLIRNGRLKIYRDLLGETVLADYARYMANALLKRIEKEFGLRIPTSKVSSEVPDKQWKRFRNVFFGT